MDRDLNLLVKLVIDRGCNPTYHDAIIKSMRAVDKTEEYVCVNLGIDDVCLDNDYPCHGCPLFYPLSELSHLDAYNWALKYLKDELIEPIEQKDIPTLDTKANWRLA